MRVFATFDRNSFDQAMQVEKILRACLYERRDGTFTETGRCPGSRHVYVSIVFIAYCLYGGWTFSVPSRLAGILALMQTLALLNIINSHATLSSRLTGTRELTKLSCKLSLVNSHQLSSPSYWGVKITPYWSTSLPDIINLKLPTL